MAENNTKMICINTLFVFIWYCFVYLDLIGLSDLATYKIWSQMDSGGTFETHEDTRWGQLSFLAVHLRLGLCERWMFISVLKKKLLAHYCQQQKKVWAENKYQSNDLIPCRSRMCQDRILVYVRYEAELLFDPTHYIYIIFTFSHVQDVLIQSNLQNRQ